MDTAFRTLAFVILDIDSEIFSDIPDSYLARHRTWGEVIVVSSCPERHLGEGHFYLHRWKIRADATVWDVLSDYLSEESAQLATLLSR